MSRPVQPIGTFGTFAVKKVRERTFYASTRFGANNGGYIRFSATGATDGAAQRELKRNHWQRRFRSLLRRDKPQQWN
jgi:hypothetical protein